MIMKLRYRIYTKKMEKFGHTRLNWFKLEIFLFFYNIIYHNTISNEDASLGIRWRLKNCIWMKVSKLKNKNEVQTPNESKTWFRHKIQWPLIPKKIPTDTHMSLNECPFRFVTECLFCPSYPDKTWGPSPCNAK